MGNETERYPSKGEEARLMEIRRETLNKIAKEFNIPEVTEFVAAVLESQDKQMSILKTLEGQAEQLRQALSKG